MKDVSLRIGGKDVAAASGRSYDKHSYTGEVVARVPDAGSDDADAAANAASAAFRDWSRISLAKRRAILWKAADLMEARAGDLAKLMTLETGSTFGWGMFNALFGASILRESAACVSQIQGETIPSDHPGTLSLSVRQPVGVVLGLAPWNAPIILGVRAVAMPLACGNTVIFKASEETPLTHRSIVDVLEEAGLPPGVINLLTTSREGAEATVDALIRDPRVRRINFTGSTHVGRVIAEKAGRHLKPVLLELGGKAPLVVLDDADLDEAAAAASFGAFMHQGQICMSTERLVVHERVKDAFVQKVLAKANALKVGDPQSPATQIGSLINAAAAVRVKALVDDATQLGASVLCGGTPKAAMFPPTVIDRVSPKMRIYSEESFGPVVIVLPVSDDEEAIRVANDSEYGLSAAVFGGDIERAYAVAERIESGICHINSATVDDEASMPFGGVKSSGFGRFGGRAAIHEFTELRWITIQMGQRQYPI